MTIKTIYLLILGLVQTVCLLFVKKYNPGLVWINAIYYIWLLVLFAI